MSGSLRSELEHKKHTRDFLKFDLGFILVLALLFLGFWWAIPLLFVAWIGYRFFFPAGNSLLDNRIKHEKEKEEREQLEMEERQEREALLYEEKNGWKYFR